MACTLNPKPYRGTSLIRNPPPPLEHHRSIGIVLIRSYGVSVAADKRGNPVDSGPETLKPERGNRYDDMQGVENSKVVGTRARPQIEAPAN